MDAMIERLRNLGCDIEGSLDRMLGDSKMYVDCLKEMSADINFEELHKALEQEDADLAFHYAHAIKGVAANLGLTPLYNKVVVITESLRRGSLDGMKERYAELMDIKKQLLDDGIITGSEHED